MRSRTRTCGNPAPLHGGRDCEGSARQEEFCPGNPRCPYSPINGQWSMWSSWAGCSERCYGGVQTRRRNCDNPPPRHNGIPCIGNTQEWRLCNNHNCAAKSKIVPWSEWIKTNTTRGGYFEQRLRFSCSAPVPDRHMIQVKHMKSQVRFCFDNGVCHKSAVPRNRAAVPRNRATVPLESSSCYSESGNCSLGIEQLFLGIGQLFLRIVQLFPGIGQLFSGIEQLFLGIEQLFLGIGQLFPGIEQLFLRTGQLFPWIRAAVTQNRESVLRNRAAVTRNRATVPLESSSCYSESGNCSPGIEQLLLGIGQMFPWNRAAVPLESCSCYSESGNCSPGIVQLLLRIGQLFPWNRAAVPRNRALFPGIEQLFLGFG
ncbi:SEMA5 [Acanthosepion pharaonis]|uniref:SEMA5 n=1 Tax=Acanthosepion pharaonis TaxID=158019 RepID=A0A812AYV5_ACAPH|nr:SEMA5 [Sepia pharaonis]